MDAASTSTGSTGTPARPWRAWAHFVRHPVLPDRAATGLAGGLRTLAPLLGLDLIIMGLLIGAVSLAAHLGFKLPEHALDHLKLTPVIVALVVIAAPVVEETVFRGWLSGRPGHIAAIVVLLAGAAWMVALRMSVYGLAGMGVAALLAIAAAWALRRQRTFGWFQRHFGWFFWGSALTFAALHLSNFGAAGPAMLPLVMPQFVLALFLGYLRVTRGLWTSMLMHMLHNSIFIGLILTGLG
ncbi:type II CAAX prenyl endopeptidase Rce1 family protein [Parablastomonas sp. CN1-191]|uniref:CPBP family glutamic-type intramembrane protease n=1 Tax=Parablastomonas sp. CN1-191 TaxID=3400908 RepID=UPI003BF846AC